MLYHVYDVWRKFYFLKGAENLEFSESKFFISGQTCDKGDWGKTGRMGGGGVAEWLERWTCNSEAPSSDPRPRL